MPVLLVDRTATRAVITLNRPEKLNALSHELFAALNEELTHLENDKALRVLILTGAGERAFCAGTDISELAMSHDGEMISTRGQRLGDRLENFPVPVITAINGIAAGGGLELALACHLRIASSNATFSVPEIKLGLIPAYGGTQRLVRDVGLARANEMMLTGRTLTSDEAFNLGLVSRVVGPSQVLAESFALADEIEQLSPLSIRACLKAVIGGLGVSLSEGLKIETELFASVFDTDDAREGISAFLEKREPNFNRG